MKLNAKILIPLLFVIILSGGILFFFNYKYNTEDHTVSLINGAYNDDEIEFKICARGEGTDELASWRFEFIDTDESGNEVVIPYIGTIYEMTVTNKSSNLVKDWNFTVSMPEHTNINAGWNGEFEIHQYTDSDSPAVFATSDFNISGSSLESFISQGCLLIPLNEGDWFSYTPSYIADEVEIPASVVRGEYTSKTIGFILYSQTEDPLYLMSFDDCTVNYHMYSKLLNSKSFRLVCLAFGIWIFVALEILTVYFQTRKIIQQNKRTMKIINEAMETFANFIDAKDPNTKGHSVRVAHYSKLIAEKLGMNDETCQDIYYIGLLHDCGKISIPNEILMKPSRLNDEEYSIMKSHAQKGADMLTEFKIIPDIGAGACSHHERFDGKGYPNGLKGEDIPMIGRIICIADAFDAMNSKRCYRDKLDRDTILNEIKKNRGIQFDPDITDLFLSLIDSGEITL